MMHDWHFIVVLICIALAPGCRGSDRTRNGAAEAEAHRGGSIIVHFDAEPETLNPVLRRSANAAYTLSGGNNSQVYESLLGYDTKTWSLTEPLLAASYPLASADNLSYVFTLREGVRWHDGRPFTAEDVVFTYKAAMCPLVDSAPVRSYFTTLVNVEAIDDRTVRFTFSKPAVNNVANSGGQLLIIPRHIFDPDRRLSRYSFREVVDAQAKTEPDIQEFAVRFNQHPHNRAPVGTGPYRFVRWDTGIEIHLARNEDYWGKKAQLDSIVYRIITDYTAALTALKAGEVDFMPRVLPAQYADLTGGKAFPRLKTATYSIPQYAFIGWNESRRFFADKRVRQAMTMLIDRQLIIEKLRFGLAIASASHFMRDSPAFNPGLKAPPYDPRRAGELLDAAGWADHDGDGFRDKEGVPFKFEFLGSSGSVFTAQLMPFLKDSFRKAGIGMTERVVEFTVFMKLIQDHNFDAAASAWLSPLDSDPFQIFHSSASESGGSNWVSFRNPRSDDLLEKARDEFDLAKRIRIYQEWQEVILDEQPYTFLFYQREAAAYHSRFSAVWIPNRPGYDLTRWFAADAN